MEPMIGSKRQIQRRLDTSKEGVESILEQDGLGPVSALIRPSNRHCSRRLFSCYPTVLQAHSSAALLGAAVEIFGELSQIVDVAALGRAREIAEAHVFDRALP